MSKKQPSKKTANTKKITVASQIQKSFSEANNPMRFISGKGVQILFIVVIACIFYGNSVYNDFASDDGEFYYANQFVQKGVAGIPDLFTKESMYGYYAHASIVSGGRWRPLSLITFAIEKEFFNADPHISHFINLLLLIITGIIMLFFLRKYVFPPSPLAAFMVVLLFIIHPIHTEAVSHIKSRDELLSWLFLLLTMYCSLNFLTKRNYWQLLFSLLFYFLALLSKENGATFIVILPLTYYFFTTKKWRSIVLTTLPFAVVLGFYAYMRFSLITVLSNKGNDINFAPYLFATPVQHIATALMLLGKYLLLLFWPNPLNSDYSYNQVPYINFSDWRVWLSVLTQAALVLYALVKLKEKDLVSYGILFYFCSIFMVSNVIIDVGTFIGERFLYQPSFGFCIAIVAAASQLLTKIQFRNTAQKISSLSALIAVVVVLSGFQTIHRNSEWKNNKVLFSADVKNAPNSMALHEGLGIQYLNDGLRSPGPQQRSGDFDTALVQYDSAITILPTYAITWFNLGYLYLEMGNSEDALKAFHKCVDLDSTFSQGYNGLGSVYYNEKNYAQALPFYKKGAQVDSANAQFYFNLGLCYFQLGQAEKAIPLYKKTLDLVANMQDQRVNLVDPQVVKQDLLNAENELQNKK
jgi:Tfp pilus assembly protein PilF